MKPETFSKFYRFVFFLCREPAKRNLQVSHAAAWDISQPQRHGQPTLLSDSRHAVLH